MRRAERPGDSWSGHWSLPGGRRSEADPDLLETALRELREECGIRLDQRQVAAALPPAVARRREGPFLLVAPYVFDVDAELPTMLDANEAAGALWLPLATLLDPGEHSLQRVPGVAAPMWFPAIHLPGAPLWGFTYRLLADWLNVSPHERRQAGFDVARTMLDFLLARGLTLRRGWHRAPSSDGDGAAPARVAAVDGPIPAEAVAERFSAPGAYVARVNRVEIRPEFVRIHGLAFEEYRIEAAIG